MSLQHSLKIALFALSLTSTHPLFAAPQSISTGQIADTEVRHIATYFPGRMAGSPAEMMAAEYLKERFRQMGYPNNIRTFNTRYIYISQNGQKVWRNITPSTVIAAKVGHQKKQIVLLTHYDTYTPLSDKDIDDGLGGLSFQGINDNAASVGVMLELAEHLRQYTTDYTIKFIVLSGEEVGGKGIENYIKKMSSVEAQNTQLVINLDTLIAGDKLALNTLSKPSAPLAKEARLKAMAQAHQNGIPIIDLSSSHTYCANNKAHSALMTDIAQAGLPILAITSANKRTSAQKTCQIPPFSHQGENDSLAYFEKNYPGQINKRNRDTVRILLPVVLELAGGNKSASKG